MEEVDVVAFSASAAQKVPASPSLPITLPSLPDPYPLSVTGSADFTRLIRDSPTPQPVDSLTRFGALDGMNYFHGYL